MSLLTVDSEIQFVTVTDSDPYHALGNTATKIKIMMFRKDLEVGWWREDTILL